MHDETIKIFEGVSSFKCLSNVNNKEGNMSECVKEHEQGKERVQLITIC
jgi:hypothetical protein